MSEIESLYPINYVARQTGLSAHTIRIWERRYEAVVPTRTNTKHRQYSEKDIERLSLLYQVSGLGYKISKIAKLPNETLRGYVREAYTAPGSLSTSLSSASSWNVPKGESCLERCKAASFEMDRDGMDRLLTQASVEMPLLQLLEEIVSPLMRWVGDGWHKGKLRIAHEHLTSMTVRALLERLRRSVGQNSDGPRITITTTAGQQHEMGALQVSLVAAMEGWNDLYFGPNMPAVEIAKAAVASKSNAVAISATLTGEEGIVYNEILHLKECLPQDIALICGGPGLALLKDKIQDLGAWYAEDLESFQGCLGKLRA